MKSYRYVILDPTGNLTALVTEPADKADEAELTRALLEKSEQVAYLEPPVRPEAAARIRLMGGEFCGNAAMASAAWLLRNEPDPGMEKALLLEVSGAAEPVLCTVRRTPEGYEGTVEMPGVPEIDTETLCGIPFTAVRMEGITHLICEDRTFRPAEAEKLLREIAEKRPEEAIGLLQWNRETRCMTPLVWVRGSGSLVWEHGCGSGSAAVGAAEALRKNGGKTVTEVIQPGGMITVTAVAEDKIIRSVSICGKVRLGTETTVEVS